MDSTRSSGPVDVLAVMEESARLLWVDAGKDSESNALLVAKAAVAELIEADKAYDAAKARHRSARNKPWLGDVDDSSINLTETWKRRAAALANVGGAK